jgi:hypothetical protein
MGARARSATETLPRCAPPQPGPRSADGRFSRALPPAPVSVRPARIESSASKPARVAGQASGAGELAGALATGGGAYYLAVLKGRRAQSTAGAALRRAWHTVQHMTCNMRRTTCNVQHATCNMRRTTCDVQPTTCIMRRGTHGTRHMHRRHSLRRTWRTMRRRRPTCSSTSRSAGTRPAHIPSDRHRHTQSFRSVMHARARTDLQEPLAAMGLRDRHMHTRVHRHTLARAHARMHTQG